MQIQTPLQRLVGKAPPTTRVRFALGAMALCLFATLGASHYQRRRQNGLPPLARKAKSYCLNMFGSCDTVSAPKEWDGDIQLPSKGTRYRRTNSIFCQVNERQFMMIFNPKDNRLISIIGQGRGHTSRWTEKPQVVLQTPQDAFDMSLLRLKQLEMVTPGANFKLVAPPKLQPESGVWQVDWDVTRPGVGKPHRLRLGLDRIGGAPVLLLDTFNSL